MKLNTLIFFLLGAASISAASTNPVFVPDFKVRPDDYTALLVADAKYSDGLRPFSSGGHGKFYMVGWKNEAMEAVWHVNVDQPGDYVVNVLLQRKKEPRSIIAEVEANGTKGSVVLPATSDKWERLPLTKLMSLPRGPVTITLRLKPVDAGAPFEAFVEGIELVRSEVRDELHRKAIAQRSDTTWFQKAKFGVFIHWTWQSKPRNGPAKPYATAVKDFNIPAFVAQIKETGAGFVVFTTSHAFQSIPAPCSSLDQILSGRTANRDLIGELADALNKEGIRLMLYYHIGAADDKEWMEASGFWNTDSSRLFENWQKIIAELGERYKDKLSGWWFDDGSVNYYYRSAPWEKLAGAAKAGNPNRLIAFNPWRIFSPTEFQDFYCGEMNWNPDGYGGLLKPDGNGHYPAGMLEGLQGSASVTLEREWVHGGRDTEITKTRQNPQRLAAFLKKCIQCKNVPIFNMEIYQEGNLSPYSVEVLRNMNRQQ